jgi:hypothetical protein
MAFLAIQLEVHASQQEVLVIFRSVFPATFIVTLRTERTVGPSMRILVASLAIALLVFREQILPFEVPRRRLELFIGILMAFHALHLAMLALQFEVRFLMIKRFQPRELLGRMTHAARLVMELRMEHILMFIYVAFLAEPAVRPFEHEFCAFTRRLGRQREITGLVALAALTTDFRMPTGELESCNIVIKLRQFGKTTGSVTARTGFFLEFTVELLFVNGLVAVGTVFFILVFIKVEFVSRFGRLCGQLVPGRNVALLTVPLEFRMLSVDLEVRDLMVEGCPLGEVGSRVALGTGHVEELLVKLLFVDTWVTSDAEITIRIRELECFLSILHMALLAVGRLVLAGQRESCLVMEGPIRLDLALQAHRFPAFRRMALVTAHTLEFLMECLGMW